MPPSLTSITDDVLIAADNLADLATGLINPTLRLGVTGLSRSGKTVFITSLVHNLLNGGRLPLLAGRPSGPRFCGSSRCRSRTMPCRAFNMKIMSAICSKSASGRTRPAPFPNSG